MLVCLDKNGIFPYLFANSFSQSLQNLKHKVGKDPIVISTSLALVKLPLFFWDTLSNIKLDVVVYTTPVYSFFSKKKKNLRKLYLPYLNYYPIYNVHHEPTKF
jgi:hypothetical protein